MHSVRGCGPGHSNFSFVLKIVYRPFTTRIFHCFLISLDNHIYKDVLKYSSDRPDQVEIGKDELIENSARPSDEYYFPLKISRIKIIIRSL